MTKSRLHAVINTIQGVPKMYTRFKRCYLRIMCMHFFGTLCIL